MRRLTRLRLRWPAAFAATLMLAAMPSHSAPVTLLYSGNLNGELEPCGCTIETDYGGLLRRATLVDEIRQTRPELVTITTGGLLTADIASDRIKSEFILSGMAMIGYDAIGVQWPDLAYGPALLAGSELPFVASNWHDRTLQHETRIERSDATLAYFQWLDPLGAPQMQLKMESDTLPVTGNTDALAIAIAAARKRGEVTVLATTLSLEEAQATLPLEDVSILLIRAAKEHPGEVIETDGMLVLTPGTRGMRVSRLDFEADGEGRVTQWNNTVIELTNETPDASRMADWYEAYNQRLREAYFASVKIRKARKSGETPYVGAETCIACHETAGEIWRMTNHAGTLGLLEAVGKAFDPNCIGCHVVAADRDGGYLSNELTPQLANVQCESCHGPGREHVTLKGEGGYPREDSPPSEACFGCHNANHSPSFDRSAYWLRIIHPE